MTMPLVDPNSHEGEAYALVWARCPYAAELCGADATFEPTGVVEDGATTYIVVETQCEHGFIGPGDIFDGHRYTGCPGGSRRVLTEGQYVLIARICSECGGTFGTCFNAKLKCCPDCAHFPSTLATSAADALSDHTEGTP